MADSRVLKALEALLENGGIKRVFVARRGEAPPGAWLPGHPHLEIVLHGALPIQYLSGSGPVQRRLVRGDAFFAGTGAWNLRSFASARTLFCIHFLPRDMRWTLGHRSPSDPEGLDPQDQELAGFPLGADGQWLLNALVSAEREGRSPELLLALFHVILRTAREAFHGSAAAWANPPGSIYQSIREHMRECCHLPINRSSVARSFGLSPDHISRLFREAGSLGFHKYLDELRLGRACALLAPGKIPVAEVARQCGFNEPGYFIKVFRRHYGTSPGRWRGAEVPETRRRISART
ncbi:MAG: helix-turn-helix transcriptional regulator [Spirochaetes bacterium]|nr:helix-turn-helix transcriptional regulator [Spirochaetota bacterium]